MKTLTWTGVWLAAAVSSLAAQEDYVWVVNSSGSVTVKTAAGATVTDLTAGFNFNQPYDIVAVPRYNLMVVSNNGAAAANHLTLINATTFAFAGNLTLPNATNVRGLSVSADEEWVFIAGKHNATDPGVFQVRMADSTPTLLGSIPDAPNFAEDCVVVSASAVGGSGSGPGRVYYSVPAAPGYLGVIPVNPPGPVTSISMGAGALNDVTVPTRLERTPDHAVVFAACSTTNAGGPPAARQRLLHVAVATNVATQPVVRATVQFLPNQVLDVAFRGDGPPYRGYINAAIDSGSPDIVEIDATGAALPVPAQITGVPASQRIRFGASPERLYIGETSGTSGSYGVRDASVQPVGLVAITASAAAGPRSFAFSPRPLPPLVSAVSPAGLVSAANTTIEIRGAHFDPACTVDFYDQAGIPAGRTVTFVHAGLLLVNGDGLTPQLYEVRITNPDAQNFRLANYFLAITTAGPPFVDPSPFAVPVPTRVEGYALRSFPQFYRAADLMAGVQARFGGYNPSTIRIFFQNGAGYAELPAMDPSLELMGRSFWVVTRSGGSLDLTAPRVGSATQLSGQDARVVILQPGWNMIGQPTVNSVSGLTSMTQPNIAVYADPALGASIGSLDAVAGAAVTSFLAQYRNGAYVFLAATDNLRAGEGYWLRNNTSGQLYLRFLTSVAVAPKGSAPASAPKVLPVPAGDALPPAPPSSAVAEGDSSTGCGALGLDALLVLAFLRAARRRRLSA